MLKDQSSGVRGAQLAIQLLCQLGFCAGCAIWLLWACVCHGLLPSCAKCISAAFNFQDAPLRFVARSTKKSLESSSCPVSVMVDEIERYLFHHSLCNFFHNFTVLDRAAGKLQCTCQSQRLLKGSQERQRKRNRR